MSVSWSMILAMLSTMPGLSRICTAACERWSTRYGNWLGAFPRKASGCPARKHGRHPDVLAKQDIRRLIEALPEPTKSVVVGSLRIGEVATLRWVRIHSDRIEIVERFYEGEFDDTKTDAGRGASCLIPSEFCLVLDAAWQRSKYPNPAELVFHFPCCSASLRAGRRYCVG